MRAAAAADGGVRLQAESTADGAATTGAGGVALGATVGLLGSGSGAALAAGTVRPAKANCANNGFRVLYEGSVT